MLIKAEQSLLLIIDVQEKLAAAMPDGPAVIDNCRWLLQIAGELDISHLVSEQYPLGLGPTVAPIKTLLARVDILNKTCFSCSADATIRERIAAARRRQLILAGMESHVCVLQTALGFNKLDYDVFLVADAVCSRKTGDKELALQRAQANGIELVSREMVAFEWLRDSKTAQFSRISKNYLR